MRDHIGLEPMREALDELGIDGADDRIVRRLPSLKVRDSFARRVAGAPGLDWAAFARGPISRRVRDLSIILNHPLNCDHRIKALARLVSWQLRARRRSLITVPFANGAEFVASRGMHGATGNIYCGLHEFEEMAFLLHVLRAGDMFLDVGANVGSYSLLAASRGARVVAFEPGERFEDLTRNARHNGYDIDCRPLAVGERNGEVKFTVGLDSTNHVAEAGESGASVPMVRLDDAAPTADVIKVDTEGFEAAVVAGGQKAFAGAKALIMELDPTGDGEPLRTLRAMGFSPISYDPFARRIAPARRSGNAILIRGDDVPLRLRDAAPFRVLDWVI